MPSDGKSSLCLWQGELKNGFKKKNRMKNEKKLKFEIFLF
jgi:hypothetical protein